jgi:hypothetical protein
MDENDGTMYQTVVRCPQAMKSLRTIKEAVVDYDNPTSRNLSIFLSKSKMVQNNLCKLITISMSDEAFMKIIIKISFVILSPISVFAKNALHNVVRVKIKGKETSDEASERSSNERSSKENAIQQISALLSFKEDFSSEAFIKGLCLVIHKALERNKFESSRSEEDARVIELVLKVISHLLMIDASAGNSSPAEMMKATYLHHDLVKKFSGPIFDLVVSFCVDMDAKDNHELLAIFIDIITHILRGFEPEELFTAWKSGNVTIQGTKSRPPLSQQQAQSRDAELSIQKKKLSQNLSNLLCAEKSNRDKLAMSSLSKNRRLNGVYKTVVQSTEVADGDEEDAPSMVRTQAERVTNNPFSLAPTGQVQTRRNRRNKLFTQVCSTHRMHIDEAHSRIP